MSQITKPLIGISCKTRISEPWSRYSTGLPMDAVYRAYASAVEQAGGIPILIPIGLTKESLKTICEKIDGLLLSGGTDIHPKFFNEEPLRSMGEIDIELDQTELSLLEFFVPSQKPILGICRGLQVINVYFGGRLYQDIAEQTQSQIAHDQKAPLEVPTHQVSLEDNCRLQNILKEKNIWVNSFHHESVKELGSQLKISALASDGIIEAIEHTTHPYLLSVQWHPEGLYKQDLPTQKLFRSFIQNCHPQEHD